MSDSATAAPIRILIAGSGQSGNTWLMYLMSEVYGLPIINLPLDYDFEGEPEISGSWIVQQHFHCKNSLLNWADRYSVRIVTPIRHPGDVLISQHNHLKHSLETGETPAAHELLLISGDTWLDENRLNYARNHFFYELACSIGWVDSGKAISVRYEDLWRDTPSATKAICKEIVPVTDEKILSALTATSKNILAKWSKTGGSRFRDGGVGRWAKELPGEVIQIFNEVQPYPIFFERLGYSLNPDDKIISAPRVYQPPPWTQLKLTGLGEAEPVYALFYRILAHVSTTRLFADSEEFYNWLNSPSDLDAFPGKLPLISNLAQQLHDLFPHISGQFPDIFRADRSRFVYLWYLKHAASERDIPERFIEPMRESFVEWAMQPYPEHVAHPRTPSFTNLAILTHDSSQELQRTFPHPFDADRVPFAAFCVNFLPRVANLPDKVIYPIIDSWISAPHKKTRD